MKFLVDMALSPGLSSWLREQSHDAIHASELGLDRAPDSDILRLAADAERVVITADLDFPRLLAQLGVISPGLILLRGGNYSEKESLDCIRRVLSAIPLKDLLQSIVVVDQQKIRRRPLPV
jgi:predicted nuclease of predicted toxin-antitoxin system